MKSFLKTMIATTLGSLLAISLLFLIAIGVIGALASGIGKQEITVKDNSVLTIDLESPILDREIDDPFATIFMSEQIGMGLRDMISAIKTAKEDSKIKGIVMRSMYSPNSYAMLGELRDALLDFKTSGKFIYAHVESMEEHAYYIYSIADHISMHPTGDFLFNGTTYSVAYLKGMFDKIGITVDLIRHGKYKAAGEPLIAEQMSAENREQIASFTGDIYTTYMEQIAKSKNMATERLMQISSNLEIQRAETAVELGLIDSLMFADEFEAMVKSKLELAEKKEVKYISLDSYYSSQTGESKENVKDKIAIVYAIGEIISGEGGNDQMGSDEMVKALKKARKDSTIKAVVLRINSPGGSALASDIIWREVVLTKAIKPVIVSMGDVAASGGYYIAAPANKILVQPATITGSIGIFGALFNAQELMNKKLGIRIEKVNQGEYADLGSPDRPLKPGERAIIQNMVDRIYDDFITRVAEGRNMSKKDVDAIAEGRVWAGKSAIKIGLADTLGSFEDAIAIAAQYANLQDYKIIELPRQKSTFEQLFKGAKARIATSIMPDEVKWMQPHLKMIEQAKRMHGIQARMPLFIIQE
jgi:protease-4